MFRGASGEIECFIGYRKKKQPHNLTYYHPSVADREPGGRTSFGFIKLYQGVLHRGSFLRDDSYYQPVSDKWLVLPKGTDGYFGIIDRDTRDEDAELTRKIFGASIEDITEVATALAQTIGRGHHEMLRLPRVTFSKTRDNTCDISGCLIPSNFPYIAFDQAQYAWSHVSLYGFYRLLGFLCSQKRRNSLRGSIIDQQVPEELLDALIGNSDFYGFPIVPRDPFDDE